MYSVSIVCSISETTGEKDFFKDIADSFAAVGFCDIYGDGAASFSQRTKGRPPFSIFHLFSETHTFQQSLFSTGLFSFNAFFTNWIFNMAIGIKLTMKHSYSVRNSTIGTNTTNWMGLLFTTVLQPGRSSMNNLGSMDWSKRIIKWPLRSSDLAVCDFFPWGSFLPRNTLTAHIFDKKYGSHLKTFTPDTCRKTPLFVAVTSVLNRKELNLSHCCKLLRLSPCECF